MPPQTTLAVARALAARGYPDADIHAIVAGNFRRVAAQTWEPAAAAP